MGNTAVVCNENYDNCFYCDEEEGKCKPGCSDDQNCPGDVPICTGQHICAPQGLQLHIDGRYGTECSTNSLDNSDRVDYAANNEAVFNSTILGGNDDHGLGGCNNFDLNVGVTGATATWTGEGTWTPQADKPICVNFYDPEDNKPTCCCDMSKKSLDSADVADLSCSCFM